MGGEQVGGGVGLKGFRHYGGGTQVLGGSDIEGQVGERASGGKQAMRASGRGQKQGRCRCQRVQEGGGARNRKGQVTECKGQESGQLTPLLLILPLLHKDITDPEVQ